MRRDILCAMNEEMAQGRAFVLVTDLASGDQRLARPMDDESDPLADEIRASLGRDGGRIVEWAGRRLFLLARMPPRRLIAVGAVHISQALAPIAKLAGFDMVIVDPRAAFTEAERFPDHRLVRQWPQDALPALKLNPRCAVVLLTHDPKIDDPGLALALAANCLYIGALGSRKTHANRLKRLKNLGFDEGILGRIRAPIGMDIGAATPAEIAVAIMAEIIAAFRGKGEGVANG